MTIYLAIEYVHPDAPGTRVAHAYTTRAAAEAHVARHYYGGRVQDVEVD